MSKSTAHGLPKSVKVGPLTYRIEEYGHNPAAEDRNFGRTDHLSQLIRVATHHGEERMRETFLHEMLHACRHVFDSAGEHVNSEHAEENFVRSAAYGLAAVLADNPDVRRFLLK